MVSLDPSQRPVRLSEIASALGLNRETLRRWSAQAHEPGRFPESGSAAAGMPIRSPSRPGSTVARTTRQRGSLHDALPVACLWRAVWRDAAPLFMPLATAPLSSARMHSAPTCIRVGVHLHECVEGGVGLVQE